MAAIIKQDLDTFVLEALRDCGGSAKIADICKYVWEKHNDRLEDSGDIFYTWQYEIRWAGQRLAKAGRIVKGNPQRGYWSIKK